MNMTIAQQLGITEFPFIIKDNNKNEIYWEDSYGNWYKRKYDSNGYVVYYVDSNGYWYKKEYDSHGNQTRYENSDGVIRDIRPKKTYSIPIMWQSCKRYSVVATSLREATIQALKHFLSEPNDDYLDDSFEIDMISILEDYPNETIDMKDIKNQL